MSSTLLQARQLTRHHGDRTVLDAVDLRVDATSRIGLVGPNGAGKTTLLRVLAGDEPPDGGVVLRHGSVGHLPQLAQAADLTRPVRDVVLGRLGVVAASRALDRHAAALEAGDLGAVDAHAAALERWLALGGHDAEPRVAAACAEVGLDPALLDRPLGTLSGGQAARAGLAALRADRHDVVLLDEPANHLDDDGLAHLATFLREHAGGVVLVAHDRALLAEVVDEVVALDPRTGRATHWSGGFDAFERERAAAHRRALADHEQARERRDALAAAAAEVHRRASATAAGVRHRLPDGDKHSREWVRMRAQERQGRARRIAGRAERVEVPDRPWEDRPLQLGLTAAERRTPVIVELQGAVLRHGAWALGPLDLTIGHGDRIELRGPNGSGKSTLLAALLGSVPPADGARRVAAGAVVALLGQERDVLAADPSPLAAAVRRRTGLGESAARTALAAFGLGAGHATRPAASLSPGERTRAELAVLGHRRATCLLLDEPTTHLDLEALAVLEAALRDWPGALVVATHDRRLREALRLTREVAL